MSTCTLENHSAIKIEKNRELLGYILPRDSLINTFIKNNLEIRKILCIEMNKSVLRSLAFI